MQIHGSGRGHGEARIQVRQERVLQITVGRGAAQPVPWVDAVDAVAVGVERQRQAVAVVVAPEHIEGGASVLRVVEAGVGAVGRVVDQHQQHRARAAALEPIVLAAVELDQFADVRLALAPLAVAVTVAPPLPQALLDQPAPQCLVIQVVAVALGQVLGGQRRTEIGVTVLIQLQDRTAFGLGDAP